jgi:hypothetical protein
MSEAELKVEFPDEKLDALRYFTEKSGSTVEDKLKEYLDKTYEKVVPQQVRDYVENRNQRQAGPAQKESSDTPASDLRDRQPRQTRRQQREQAAAELSSLPQPQPEENAPDESEGQGMSMSM